MNSPAPSKDWSTSAEAVFRQLRRPLWILAALASIAAIRLGRDVLVPLMLSLLIALVLSGLVEWLHRYRIPRVLSAFILLLTVTGAIGGICQLVWSPAQQWIQSAPRVLHTIENKVRPAQSVVRRIGDLATRATSLGGPAAAVTTGPAAAAPTSSMTAAGVVAETGWIVAGIATVMAFTLLLLAAGPPTLARMTAALASDLHAVHVLKIIDAIRVEVGRYYRTLALINLGLGIATAIATWLLGMPNPILWGVLAGVLNFIPYLGSATTLVVLTVVALVTFDTIPQALMVSATYLVLAAIEGQIVQPVLVGRRLDLNPIVVFLALWVGGCMWGIPGVVFALPVLVATKVAASHSSGGEVIARFLSPSGNGPRRSWRRSSTASAAATVR